MTSKQVKILTIAGSDSGGGAGIQADIKTVSALGGYAMSAVTALTAQNTLGISAVMDVPAEFIEAQIRDVLSDIGADAIKVGMLRESAAVEAVIGALDALAPEVPLVVDPILAATEGTEFLDAEAMSLVRAGLVPIADVITPNIPEAEALTGMTIGSLEDMKVAADKLMGLGPQAVFLTGGHLEGPEIFDVLTSEESIEIMTSSRIETTSTHGTGCTLSAAIATFLAQKFDLREAVTMARDFVREAMENASGFGQGTGPLNHQFLLQLPEYH